MNLFSKARKEFQIVELEKVSPLPELTAELKDSLRTLQNHPGFFYLLNRLKLERAALEGHLRENLDLNEQQLHHLQSGIYFSNWLENTLLTLTQVPRKQSREATSTELELLDRAQRDLDAHLERIG